MKSLKLTPQTVGQLDELEKEITSRMDLWMTLDKWDIFRNINQDQSVKNL